MKILYLSKMDNGGIKTYVDNLMAYMQRLSLSVVLFDLNLKNKNLEDFLNDFSKILFSYNPNVIHINNFNLIVTPKILNIIQTYKINCNKNCKVIYTAHGYDLICITHDLYNSNNKEICEKCINSNSVNCFYSNCISDNILKQFKYSVLFNRWLLFDKSYNVIDHIICCSNFMKSKIDMIQKFKHKTITIHNFVVDNNYISENKKDYVLYFGRYSYLKGIDTLIEVCKKTPNINYIFAGDGPLTKKINNVKNIKNIGFKNGNELKEIIANAIFSICPSEVYENCPFSVIESIMNGTPVLGANIGGIPELIDNNITGELFESGNVNDLYDHLISMWNDKEKLSKYSRNSFNKKFITLEEYCNILLNNYYL